MDMNIKYTSSALFFCIALGFTALSQERTTTALLNDWKFFKGPSDQAHERDFNDSGWQVVQVPHDWAIEGPFQPEGNGYTGKLPWKGEGWYRYLMNIDNDLEGKIVYLVFDGVMAFPRIFVNGHLAGSWDYGYNSFYVNITKYLDYGRENVLAVHADTRNHDSRWYPGAGIYRKVQMIIVNPVHVDIWGTFITTPIIKPHYADVRIASRINNFGANDSEVRIKHSILNKDGTKILEDEVDGKVDQGGSRLLEANITIPNPRIWDIDDPQLYTVVTEVFEGEVLMDTYRSTFGIRDMRFTANHGFYLNNRRIQFKGVNLHHDHGPLGAAFNKRAMQRQLEIMKAMGCNAIRTSHNTAAPELLDLCDEMGLLFFNEVFDKYDQKADILDTTKFEDFAHRNIRNFVVRDRNHPSLFLWSVGNEIGDVQWNKDNGFYRLNTMLNYVRKYDPTRPTTLVCDNMEGAIMRHFDFYDVHSWNYGRRYRLARQLEPDKSVIIAESASTLSTRGFYEFPLPKEKTEFTKSLQVSSYDLNAPYWAEVADDDFMWQQDEPYVAGEFVWTGFDYLGEPTPYGNFGVKRMGMTDREASRSSYFGIVDLCGIPKDRYYLYKSYWKPDELTIHILPHWNWEDRVGQNVPVFVYTNGDCAELFLNGQSLGMRCKDPKSMHSIDRFRLMWNDVVYQPGELKVVAYKEGELLGENVMKTTGKPEKLRLTADRSEIAADGGDLSYILIEALDKDGNVYPLADNKITIELTGPGGIAGVGNGNPQSLNPFQSNEVSLFYGKAMLIVKSVPETGQLKVEARSKGLKSADCTILLK